jgi:hypothetical protein
VRVWIEKEAPGSAHGLDRKRWSRQVEEVSFTVSLTRWMPSNSVGAFHTHTVCSIMRRDVFRTMEPCCSFMLRTAALIVSLALVSALVWLAAWGWMNACGVVLLAWLLPVWLQIIPQGTDHGHCFCGLCGPEHGEVPREEDEKADSSRRARTHWMTLLRRRRVEAGRVILCGS